MVKISFDILKLGFGGLTLGCTFAIGWTTEATLGL